jgi:hypothetical protein
MGKRFYIIDNQDTDAGTVSPLLGSDNLPMQHPNLVSKCYRTFALGRFNPLFQANTVAYFASLFVMKKKVLSY